MGILQGYERGVLEAKEQFEVDAKSIDALGDCYFRLKDGRGWVCERSLGDRSQHALEPIITCQAPVASEQDVCGEPSSSSTSSVQDERNLDDCDLSASLQSDCEKLASEEIGVLQELGPISEVAMAGLQNSMPPSLSSGACVLRSDADLWPKPLGAPRPIT